MPPFITHKLIQGEKKAKPSTTTTATTTKAKATSYVLFSCAIAAMSGALFGYDGGVTGGVCTMPAFQAKFFPGQLRADHDTYYCRYNDQKLQLFATTMYFVGASAGIPGAYISKQFGRTMTMTLAGTAFLVGTGILAGAESLSMLLIGRSFLGVGVGMADQSATIYSSEIAPPHLRGSLTMLFQLCVVTGILIAQSVNVGTSFLTDFGWRVSLGLAACPAFVLIVGGYCLPESPSNLIERGYLQQGRAVLEAIRGTADVDDEYGTIVVAQQREKMAGDNQFRSIFTRKHVPHLVMSIALPFFQMWTGINAVVLFAPFLFQSLGSSFVSETGTLAASVIIGAVQVLGTVFGMCIVDRYPRRHILIFSSCLTFAAELALGIVFAANVDEKTVVLARTPAIASIVLISIFVAAFGFGWGPLAWIISSEIQPLEIRSIGQGITVFVQLASGGAVGQSFLSVLCTLNYGVYIFFAGLQLSAALFVWFLVPETSKIPIEKVSEVFRVHWFWKRFTSNDEEGVAMEQELLDILDKQKRRAGKSGGMLETLRKLPSSLSSTEATSSLSHENSKTDQSSPPQLDAEPSPFDHEARIKSGEGNL